MTQIVEHFFKNLAQRIGLFSWDSHPRLEPSLKIWLKEFSDMTHRIGPFLWCYSKNWTFFQWLKEINLICKWRKELNPFFLKMTQRIEPWSNLTHRIELFFRKKPIFSKDDSKNWIFVKSMTQRFEPFKNMTKRIEFFCKMTQRNEHFFEYNSKNWTSFSNLTQKNWTSFSNLTQKNWTSFSNLTRIEPFSNLTRIEPFSNLTQKNWTFSDTWLKRIELLFL